MRRSGIGEREKGRVCVCVKKERKLKRGMERESQIGEVRRMENDEEGRRVREEGGRGGSEGKKEKGENRRKGQVGRVGRRERRGGGQGRRKQRKMKDGYQLWESKKNG